MNRELRKITEHAVRARQKMQSGSLKAKKEYESIVREQNLVHNSMMKDSRNG